MSSVYRSQGPFPLTSFLRASGLHVGAAAAAVSLRHDLVDTRVLDSAEFDEAFAIARLTPGTNLLAMFTLLGQRLAGWRGAVAALCAGVLIPAVIAGAIAAAYVAMSENQTTAHVMQGARAGALGVLLWATMRLMRPHLIEQGPPAVVLAVGSAVAMEALPIPQIVVLLVAGGAGAVLFRSQS